MPYFVASSRHQEETTFRERRPLLIWSMFAACLASRAGLWKVGRTATISSCLRVTAARAAAVDQASREGACSPFISFRYNSAMRASSKPISSLRIASFLTYSQVVGMFSSSTLRSQPPKTGIQYPYRIIVSLFERGSNGFLFLYRLFFPGNPPVYSAG